MSNADSLCYSDRLLSVEQFLNIKTDDATLHTHIISYREQTQGNTIIGHQWYNYFCILNSNYDSSDHSETFTVSRSSSDC